MSVGHFTVTLTSKQSKQVREAFKNAIRQSGVKNAAMLAQPVVFSGGQMHIDQNPGRFEVSIISGELFEKIADVMKGTL